MGKSTKSLRIEAGVLFVWAGGSVALAADMPVKTAPIAQAVYNWTGIYVGAHAGYGMGMKDWTNSIFDFDVKGFLGGGQIGVNQQIGNWVIGIEADASWANLKGTQTIIEGGPAAGITSNRSGSSIADRFVTIAGRIGFAQDRWLVYVKGGAAWVHENHTFNAVQTISFAGATLTGTTVAAGSENRFGPVIGFGAEYALWGNWSFKSEYNYLYLPDGTVRITGQQSSLFGPTAFTADLQIQQAFHLVKLGLNYRFGPEHAASDRARAASARLQLDRLLHRRRGRIRLRPHGLGRDHTGYTLERRACRRRDGHQRASSACLYSASKASGCGPA